MVKRPAFALTRVEENDMLNHYAFVLLRHYYRSQGCLVHLTRAT